VTEARDFILFHKDHTRFELQTVSWFMGEPDHFPPSSVDVRNYHSSIPLPLLELMACADTNFPS